MEIIDNTNKKVLKELDKNNISSSYNQLQRYLLSFSVKNNWEIIRKIRTIDEIVAEIAKINDLTHRISILEYMEQQSSYMLWLLQDEQHIDYDSQNV